MILKTALLCGALLFANGEAPVETPTEPEIVEPTTPTEPVEPTEPETPPVDIPTTEEVKDGIEKWLEQWLSPDTIVAISSWLTFLTTALVFIIKWTKDRKAHNLSNKELEKDITELMNTEIGKQIKEQFNEVAPQLLASNKSVIDMLKAMSKIMCLAQENTPESRVAIIEIIESLGVVEKENLEASKKTITEEKEAKIEKDKKVDEEIDKIIDDTNKDDGTRI